jgi:hypothetical protein
MTARTRNIGRFTPTAASLTGHASNVTGGSWAVAVSRAGDKMGHYVTIRNDTANDHSAKTAVLTGYDANGRSISETLTLPAGSATVTSLKAFRELASIVPSATIGADTMDIGWSASCVTQDVNVVSDSVRVDLVLISGTINYDFEHSLQHEPVSESSFIGDLTGQTVSKSMEYLSPIARSRISVNSGSSPVFDFFISMSST